MTPNRLRLPANLRPASLGPLNQRHRHPYGPGSVPMVTPKDFRQVAISIAVATDKRLRGSRDRRSSNSNASDRCATPDGYSNVRASGTGNGDRGSSNISARLVAG